MDKRLLKSITDMLNTYIMVNEVGIVCDQKNFDDVKL